MIYQDHFFFSGLCTCPFCLEILRCSIQYICFCSSLGVFSYILFCVPRTFYAFNNISLIIKKKKVFVLSPELGESWLQILLKQNCIIVKGYLCSVFGYCNLYPDQFDSLPILQFIFFSFLFLIFWDLLKILEMGLCTCSLLFFPC